MPQSEEPARTVASGGEDRGDPVWRGLITGGATFVGGILHALPFLIPHVMTAVGIALVAAALELVAIAYIRYRYMEMGFWSSFVQVVIGGVVVLGVGILVGET